MGTQWINIISFIILFLIIGGAIAYIIKSKKSGNKCIGCPHSKKCGGCCSSKDNKK